MGIETVVLLLEQSCLDDLLALTWDELYNGMEKGKFRQSRPEGDERLNRLFDIDCEAEILDWMDSVESEPGVNVKLSLQNLNCYEHKVRVLIPHDNQKFLERMSRLQNLLIEMFDGLVEVDGFSL